MEGLVSNNLPSQIFIAYSQALPGRGYIWTTNDYNYISFYLWHVFPGLQVLLVQNIARSANNSLTKKNSIKTKYALKRSTRFSKYKTFEMAVTAH